MTMTITQINSTTDLLDRALSALNGPEIVCDSKRPSDNASCIVQHSNRPWPEIYPNELCLSCAAYWHVATANNLLFSLKRTVNALEAQ